MDTDPFPAAVERLIATHDVGVPPTVFPNRKVTRTGAVPRSVPSPRGGMPPAAGVPSDGTGTSVARPVGCSGRGEGASGGNDAGGRGPVAHPTSPAGFLSALWDWTQRRRWSDLAPIFERDARDAAWRKALGR